MTLQHLFLNFTNELSAVYDKREAENIAELVFEKITGNRKIDRILNKEQLVPPVQQDELQNILIQLLKHKPVQYILGEAWFMGEIYFVNEHVLIPRPETEELVLAALSAADKSNTSLSVIDIGTGSGCIPVAIKKKLSSATITAIDISKDALQVAQFNALQHQVQIEFKVADILNQSNWYQLGYYDIIISNPPYITLSEQAEMRKNVTEYEPHLALFVPDKDPLLFYTTIATFAKSHLLPYGQVLVEINEKLGLDVQETFIKAGFTNVTIHKDLQLKDRIVSAKK